MAEVLMSVKGTNGEIDLLEDSIKLRRKGALSFITHGMQGEKEILLSQISSIQFKKASLVANGYIQFAFMGGTESKGGIIAGAQDENTVMFKRGKQQQEFEALHQQIRERQQALNSSSAGVSSSMDELTKLADLKERGMVTEQEFEQKKRELLNL